MSEVIQVAAAAITAAVCAAVVRRQEPELGLVLASCAAVLILLYCSGALQAVMGVMDKLVETGGLSAQVVEPVIKTVGIAIVPRLSADFCRDAKEGGLASSVELAGTALALVAVLPLMSAVGEVLVGVVLGGRT